MCCNNFGGIYWAVFVPRLPGSTVNPDVREATVHNIGISTFVLPGYLLITYLFTPCSRVLLAKLTGSQLVEKSPTFYGTRKFITAFTSARHLPLSWATYIQSHPTFWISILILSFHPRLGLPNGFFPSGLPSKSLYAPLLASIRATCPVRLILRDFITRTVLGEQCRSLSSSLCSFLYSPVTSSLSSPDIPLSTVAPSVRVQESL